MIYQNFLPERPKSDVIFYKAFNELSLSCKRIACFKAVLTLGLLGLAIINVAHNTQSMDIV
jgi:hypothetical protein